MISKSAPAALTELPPLDERRLACGVHLAGLAAPILAPVVAMAVFREKPFVVAHARRALTGELLLRAFLAFVFLVGAIFFLRNAWIMIQAGSVDWPRLILGLLARLLFLGILGAIGIVGSLRAALRAYRGIGA